MIVLAFALGPLDIVMLTAYFVVVVLAGVWSMRRVRNVEDYFIGEIVQRLSDALAKFFVEQGISIFQANAKLNDLVFIRRDAADGYFFSGIISFAAGNQNSQNETSENHC